MRHNRRDDGQLSCRKREMKTMNANTALDGHTTVIKMAERGGVPLSQSKAQCWFRKRKTELKIIEKTKICIPAMLKPYSASSFCLPNKNRVGVAHGDGTNLEVVYTPKRWRSSICHLWQCHDIQ